MASTPPPQMLPLDVRLAERTVSAILALSGRLSKTTLDDKAVELFSAGRELNRAVADAKYDALAPAKPPMGAAIFAAARAEAIADLPEIEAVPEPKT